MAFKIPRRDVAIPSLGAAPIPEKATERSDVPFGGAVGRAMQGAGQTLSQTANLMNAVALEQKDKQDTSLAIANYNNFRDAWRAEETGFKGREGVDAFGVTNDATASFDKSVEKYSDGLNEGAKERYLALARQSRNSTLDGMSRHEQAQSKAAFNNQMGAIAETAINDAVEDYTNPDMLKNSKTVISTAITGVLKGQKQEVIDAAIQSANTKMYKGVIDKIQDPDAAKEFLDMHKDGMDAGVVTALDKALSIRVSAERSEELVAKHYDDRPIDEIIKSIKKDKGLTQAENDDAVTRARTRRNVDNAADKERSTAAYESAWKTIGEGGTVDNLSNDILTELDSADRDKLKAEALRIANGHPQVTDSKAWQTVMTMPMNELVSKDLYREYAGDLTQDDFQRTLSLQNAAKATLSGSKLNPEQVREVDFNSVAQRVAADLGYLSLGRSIAELRRGSLSQSKEFRNFEANFRKEVDTWQSNNKGKHMSRTEMLEMGQDMAAQTVWMDNYFADTEKSIFALTEEQKKKAYADPDTRQFFNDSFSNREKNLTKEEVAALMIDFEYGNPITTVTLSDIPEKGLDLIKKLYEAEGITFKTAVERDKEYLQTYVETLINAL